MLRKFTIIFMFFALLAGCSYTGKNKYYGKSSNIDMTIGIPQRTAVTDKKVSEIETKLDKLGVNVISVGQQYRVIIPVEKIFYYETPRLRWDAFQTVNLVVDYIKQFRIVSMKISAYSRDADRKYAGALSLARARSVKDYLWSQSIDTRLVYTQSHSMENSANGCCSASKSSSDVHSNVEITFENTIV